MATEVSALPMHTRDEQCTLDEFDVCRECGVWHGEPCIECEGRGFHNDGCPSCDCWGGEEHPNCDEPEGRHPVYDEWR